MLRTKKKKNKRILNKRLLRIVRNASRRSSSLPLPSDADLAAGANVQHADPRVDASVAWVGKDAGLQLFTHPEGAILRSATHGIKVTTPGNPAKVRRILTD